MKRATFVAVILLMTIATVFGAEPIPITTGQWVGTAAGSSDLLSLGGGYRPAGGRTEFGLFAEWVDGLAEGGQEGYGGGLYASYDLVQEAPFTILSFQVPVTWSVGGQLGALHMPEVNDEDAIANLTTGLSFGDETIRIGIAYV